MKQIPEIKRLIRNRFFLLFSLLTACTTSSAQDALQFHGFREVVDHITHVFKDNHPELSFFKYRLISDPYNIYDFYSGRGNGRDSVCNTLNYLRLVNDLAVSNYQNDDLLINSNFIQRQLIKGLEKRTTPISLAFIEYSDFKDSAVLLNSFDWENNQFTEKLIRGFYPFQKKRLFASSALNQVLFTSPINFAIEDSTILSNIPGKINSIEVDFADGHGYLPITKGSVYPVRYDEDGLKKIQVKIRADTSYFYSSFTIVDSSRSRLQNNLYSGCNTAITPPDAGPIHFYSTQFGPKVTGSFAIWMSPCNTTGYLRKPYIISAGFNPGNGKQLVSDGLPVVVNMLYGLSTISMPLADWGGDWRGTYYETYNGGYNKRYSPLEAAQCGEGASNGDNYLDRLRDEGYDVIILMYDNGQDYIENNASLLIELIEWVNKQKMGAPHPSYFENIVSGYSAGAVSTRYALAKMESNYKLGLGPDPHTRMWVSIEGEHQASNVPLGLQFLLDYQRDASFRMPSMYYLNPGEVTVDIINGVAAGLAWSFCNNPTAYQLTKYSLLNPNGPTPARNALATEFANIPGNTSNGYPEFCRRVGVSMGSGSGVSVPHQNPSMLFDSKLAFNPWGNSSIHTDACGNTYTFYEPSAQKQTTARWWNSSSTEVFSAQVMINKNWTYMDRYCISFTVFGEHFCHCVGPFTWAGVNITYGNAHIPQPTVEPNWDNVPASTQSTHIELFCSSAYSFYGRLGSGGNSYAHYDPLLHCFAPTVSTLDLHDPATGLPANDFTSPFSFGLMYTAQAALEPNFRYGFPFLTHPNDHYRITPFDAVYAIGTNNGKYLDGSPKPDNQFHVEDPQIPIGDYLTRIEVAPDELLLSDRIIGKTAALNPLYTGGYTAEFEARSTITTGNGIYFATGSKNYLTPDSDFVVTNNSNVILHAGEEIALLPGTSIDPGSSLSAYIQPYTCPDNYNHRSKPGNSRQGESASSQNSQTEDLDAAKQLPPTAPQPELNVFPNPTSGNVWIQGLKEWPSRIFLRDLTGKVVCASRLTDPSSNSINLINLDPGLYFMEILSGVTFRECKIIVTK